jgi:hypothetical protein
MSSNGMMPTKGASSIAPGSRPAAAAPSAIMLVRPERRHPAVGHHADLADRLFLQRRHVDRNVGPVRLHLELEVAQFHLARQFRRQPLAGPQGAQDADRVAQARQRLLVGNAVEVLDDDLTARAEAENHPAFRDLVEGCRAHRQQARRAAEDVGDPGRKLEALRGAGDLREQLELFVGPGLGNPDRIVAEIFGELGGAQHLPAVVVLPERNDSNSHAGLLVSVGTPGSGAAALIAQPPGECDRRRGDGMTGAPGSCILPAEHRTRET